MNDYILSVLPEVARVSTGRPGILPEVRAGIRSAYEPMTSSSSRMERLGEAEWDSVFAWADRLRGASPAEAGHALDAANVSARIRSMVLLQLEIGEPAADPTQHPAGDRVG